MDRLGAERLSGRIGPVVSGFGASGRHARISDTLRQAGRVSVGDLATDLRVSVVTVRNDLEALERQGVLRRIRGGAVMVRTARFERPSHLAAESFPDEKARISAMAASLIRDGETVIIDSGTTMVALARALPRTLNDVAVVTNALDVALELEDHPGVRVAVTGGTLRGRRRSLVAPFATQLLAQINADVAFVSCAGFHPEKGFTQSNWEEAEVKHAMLAAASRSVVLADHGKFGHVGTARIAPIERVDILVSDTGLGPEAVRALEGRGPRLLLA